MRESRGARRAAASQQAEPWRSRTTTPTTSCTPPATVCTCRKTAAASGARSPRSSRKSRLWSSGKLELAAREDDRAAADLDALDLVRRALGLRVKRRRAVDLGALRDLDLVAPADLAMTRQVHRQRPGSRAGSRVLRDPAEAEHSRLPA